MQIAMFRQSLSFSRRLTVLTAGQSNMQNYPPVKTISLMLKCREGKLTSLENSVYFSTTNNLRDKDLQPTQRLVNPDQIDGVQYVESLCISLHQSQPERYSFFSPLVDKRSAILTSQTEGVTDLQEKCSQKNESQEELFQLLTSFGEDQIEQKCLEKFLSWADKSKLNIAYTLYANNLQCDAFLTRLVRHMAPQVERLLPEELVAMLIVVYLQKSWSPEDLYDVLDPSTLQHRLAFLIKTREMSNSEVCAVCHGLKKIQGFLARETDLRNVLYARATGIAHNIKQCKASTPVENMALLHISVLLLQGSLVLQDQIRQVNQFLKNFSTISDVLEARTAVKIMSFGLSRSLHNHKLTEAVLTRLIDQGDIAKLSLRDICGLLKFIVLVDLDEVLEGEDKCLLLDAIVEELNSMEDKNCKIGDVADLLQAWSHLAQFDYFETEKLATIFESLNKQLPVGEKLSQMSRDQLSKNCFKLVFKTLFPISSLQNDPGDNFSKQILSNFVRQLSSLDQTLTIFKPELKSEHRLRPDILDALIQMNQSLISQTAASASALTKTQQLTKRQRLYVSLYNELVLLLGGEDYVKLVHVLPHFQEPDIIFGQIAGIKLSIPDDIINASPSSLKPAPEVGDWYVITSEPRPVARNVEMKDNNPLVKVWGLEKREKITSGPILQPFRHRQLRELGYNVITINEDLKSTALRPWISKVVATILTGLEQGPPDLKRAPQL